MQNILVHNGTYLMFWMCYSQSVSFIEFLVDFYIYDKMYMLKYRMLSRRYYNLNIQNYVKFYMQIILVFSGPVTDME